MKEMPGRPVQREVEAAGLRAFESLLPLDWELHPRRVDFGIDVDVEIFSEGQATGLMFGVQVKGTQSLGSRPSVSIKWTTWNYWSSQDGPVLVVLWDVEGERLFWEWDHRFDTSHLEREETESFTFVFPEDQIWDDDTPGQLRREVEAWRAWSTPYAHLPIGVVVEGSGEIAGVAASRFVASLRGQIREFGDLFALEDPLDAKGVLIISVEIGTEKSVVWLSGGPSATLHYESMSSVDSDDASEIGRLLAMMTSDIMLLISRQLGLMSSLGPAARVAGAAVDHASIVHQPEVAVGVLQLLLEENRVDDAIRLLGRLLLAQDSLPGVLALLSLNSVESLNSATAERIATALRDMAWFQARTRGTGAELAYNGAQVMRSFDHSVAIELFDEASRLDSAYRQRGYWWRERGGSLFLTERYAEAVEHYQKALDMGEHQARPLLADALLFAGQYQPALELLSEVVEDDGQTRPEWRLKLQVLQALIDLTGVTHQERDTASALACLSDETESDRFRSALECDLLCPDALRELGLRAESNDERSVEFLVAEALVDPLHAHAWLRAIRSAVLEEPQILEDVGSCARRFCGSTILGVVEAEGAPEEIISSVESLFAGAPLDPSPPTELRVVRHGSADFVAVDMSDADARDTDPEGRPMAD